MGYIYSDDNRYYVAKESQYGAVAAVNAGNRFPAIRVGLEQEWVQARRRDKTGSRTHQGYGAPLRREVRFSVRTFLTNWELQASAPSYGPLFESALGGGVKLFGGGTVESVPGPNQVRLTAPHGLSVGQGVSFGGEIRFVKAVVDPLTVELNAGFSLAPTSGSPLGRTASYGLAKRLQSVSVFDYWSPDTAVQRIACGAVVNALTVSVNGDVHEMEFRGLAADLIDSASFVAGQGQLGSFPLEPALGSFSYSPVPGHLGQVWLGAIPEQFFTLTEATVRVKNGLELRANEFGSSIARGFSAGEREVVCDLSVYEEDRTAVRALYQAARQRSPIQVMFQLGTQARQLMGIYMQSVVPGVPKFDDQETKLRWEMRDCRAQGSAEDELFIAFG